MANDDVIAALERALDGLAPEQRRQVNAAAKWLLFMLRLRRTPRVEAGATILTAISLLRMAADMPGLESSEAGYIRRVMERTSSRIKLFAEDLGADRGELPFPWPPDEGEPG